MSQAKPLSEFYEKMYFHEIDAREKLYSRVSIPFAVFFSIIGGLGFLLQNLHRSQSGIAANFFYISFGLAVVFVAFGGYYLKGGASGNKYLFVSPMDKWNAYRSQCESLYAEYDNKADLVDGAVKSTITDEYIRCAAVNALVNDERSNCLFNSIKYQIVAGGFVFLAFLCFFFGGLDKASHSKPTEVTVVAPVELNLKGLNMATDRPPPPPPPAPPAREVREDKRPNSPPPVRPNGQ